jgi:hypothetical protein
MMRLSKYDRKIRRLKVKEKKYMKQMENQRLKFIKETEAFVSDWYSRYVENVAKSYPEVTTSIELDGVKSMKRELPKLIKEVQDTVENELSPKEMWSHFYKETELTLQDFVYNVARPRVFDDVVRELLYRAVPFLARHGYEKASQDLGKILQNPLRHDERLDWSSTMNATVESYSGLHKQLTDITAKIEDAQRQKIRARAEELWRRA